MNLLQWKANATHNFFRIPIILLLIALSTVSFAQTRLVNGTPVSASDTLHRYYFNSTTVPTVWSVVGVRPPSTVDYDLRLYQDAAGTNQLAASTQTGSAVDFVVADFHYSPTNTYYPTVRSRGGSGTYWTEWRASADTIPTGGISNTITWNANEVVRVFELRIYDLQTQPLTLVKTSGSADFGFAVYSSNNTSYFAGRDDALATTTTSGAIQTLNFEAGNVSWYAVVVWNNNNLPGTFTIANQLPPTIALTSPNGGESWAAGNSYPITWTSTGLSATENVKVEINRNYPLGTWDSITTVPNSGTYSWLASGPATALNRIRVSHATTSSLTDMSNNNFTITIPPRITVTAPNGGEVWQLNTTQNITWTSSDLAGNVSIEVNRGYPTGTWSTIVASTANTGTYAWTVASPASTTSRIRVRSVTTTTVGDTSNTDFTIMGPPSITVATPNGGETWQTGTSQNITWTSFNITGAVRIQLNRTYPAGTWETVTDSTDNTGTYSWAVSGAAATAARIRILSRQNTSYGDTSNANFTITTVTGITVSSPAGGETWNIGSVHPLTWTYSGVTGRVQIQINRTYPNGTWTTLYNSVAIDTTINWTVTGAASTTARIRVRTTAVPQVTGTSAANFTIADVPQITVTAPNGGESVQIGNISNITWTSTAITGNVNVQLNRTYPTGTWESLAANIPNTNTYAWTVTAPATTTARVRVLSVDNTTVGDTSNANFTVAVTVPSSITVTSPNGGESWQSGTAHAITWSSYQITGRIAIELNRTYPTGTWETVVAGTANTGTYNWTIAGAASSSARVRITSVTTPTIGDTSNAEFAITAATGIVVDEPVGGEDWRIGSTQPISWTATGVTGNVQVQINRTYPNGTWTTLYNNIPYDTTVEWTVTGAATTTARIRVRTVTVPQVTGMSAANFTISEAPVITVTAPNGGEAVQIGSTSNITWTSTAITGNVLLSLNRTYPTGTWEQIATDVPNTNSYTWTVTGPASTSACVRITSISNPTVGDTSNANFTIATYVPPTITITSPVGGENWQTGSAHAITWTSNQITGQVAIQLNRTYPTGTWESLTAGTNNTGTYNWTITGAASTTARVRITSVAAPTVGDTSSASFTITVANGIVIDSPVGGENWGIGTVHPILWTATGVTGNVQVQINRTYPTGTWTTLYNNVPYDTVINWTVTGAATTTARIRVRTTTPPQVTGTSAADFAISVVPTLALTAPDGGESWQIGSSYGITWTSQNLTGNVALDLNRNYPSGTWETLFADIANSGSQSWTVSGAATTNARIRIRSTTVTTLADTSNANFSLVTVAPPSIVITSPNGGENWQTGSAHNITWNVTNVPGNVTVQLNRAFPTGTWETLFADVANSGSQSWTVSGTGSTASRIRIYSTTNPNYADTSNANFTISVPTGIVLSSPVGGENWVVGTSHTITWTTNGVTIPGVSIAVNRDWPTGTWTTLTAGVVNNGTYTWTVTGPGSTTARIRVTSLGSTQTYSDSSHANFTIFQPSGLTVSAPNGGENWQVGSVHNITWARTNAPGAVAIQLMRNYPTGTWESIIDSCANDTSYAWTVTAPGSTTARVRVYPLTTPAYADTSNANFTITVPQSITVVAPNGGENWVIGTQHYVTWSWTGTINTVAIEAKLNYPNGNWQQVANNINNTGSYLWTVAGTASNAVRLRVRTPGGGAVGDTCDANFSLIQPIIRVTAPNGGETFAVDSVREISWISAGVTGNVSIELNRAYPTGTWESIAADVTNNGSYMWTVAGTTSTTARVRVRSVTNTTIGDSSDTDFSISVTIPPSITVTNPNGGELWAIGSQQPIEWQAAGFTGAVRIQVNRTYPTGTWEVISDSATNSGTFTWTVAGAASTTSRIRVLSRNNTAIGDTSNFNFTIMVPMSMTVTAPNGGERWYLNSAQVITWNSTGLTGNVAVDINRNYPTGNWTALAGNIANTGTYNWTVAGATTTNARIRVRSLSYPAVVDISDTNFTVATPPGIVMRSPVGGENWLVGETHNITWTPTAITGMVAIEINRTYSTGVWEAIGEAAGTDTTYSWTVNGPATTTARIRVRSETEPQYFGTSTANFTVSVPPSITVTAPNGGESWVAGTQHNITWTSTGSITNVQIDVNTNYPTGNWTRLSNGATNNGSFAWTVTNTLTANARVRIRNAMATTVGDTSNADFAIIAPTLTLTAPNGGETYQIGSTQTITWSSVGLTNKVAIYLNRSYPGTTWETVTDSTVNTGSFSWTVSGTTSTTARIRIQAVGNATIADTSDANFSIQLIQPPTITVTLPNGGDSWQIGDLRTIQWTSVNITGTVRIQLNRNYPSGTWEMLADTTTNDGSFAWIVAGTASSAARMRVLSVLTPTVGDTSNANFSIVAPPSLTVTSPNGGESYTVGSSHAITWVNNNVNGNIRIELNREYPSGTWETIVASTSNSGTYDWLVAGTATSQARIRVTSLLNNSITDVSDNIFTIVAPIIWIHHPTGEALIIGTSDSIAWSSQYVTGNVRIQVNLNYPVGTWDSIATVPYNSSPYLWAVNYAPSAHVRIRIVSVVTPSIIGLSATDFSIITPPITLLRPNGGETFYIGNVDTVRFSAPYMPNGVDIELSRDYPVDPFQSIATQVPGYYWIWNPVSGAASTNARIRVRIHGTNGVTTSAASFTIATPQITLQRPNGGEIIVNGTSDTIRWNSQLTSGNLAVLINDNYPSGNWDTIRVVPASTNSILWNVARTATTTARVKVQSLSYPSISAISAANFTIVNPQASLFILHPNGGEVLGGVMTDTIRWQRVNAAGNVLVELNRTYPSGEWEILGTTADSYLLWAITGPNTNSARVRTTLISNPSVQDVSDGNFTINITSINERTISVPHSYALESIYPNPFNASAQIVVGIPREGRVTIRVFDVLGKEVSVLYNGNATPGEMIVHWNAGTLASGTYIVSVEAPGFAQRRMIQYLR